MYFTIHNSSHNYSPFLNGISLKTSLYAVDAYHAGCSNSLKFWPYSGNEALTTMQLSNRSQSIVITGESGAGKTETTKHLLNYFCWNSNTDTAKQLIDANPIMEAFGNSRTEKNENSSRFCRYLQVTIPDFHTKTTSVE